MNENIKKLVDLLDHYGLELILSDSKLFNSYKTLLKKVQQDVKSSETDWSSK